MRITACEIGPYPRPMPQGMFDEMPKVKATFEDGSTQELFSFYPDEVSFTEGEFVGLTALEALELKARRDAAYLRS